MSFGEKYLRYPDLFPARAAGDPWGDESFAVDLPGGPYEVTGLSASQLVGMKERYESYQAEPGSESAVRVEVFTSEPSDFLPPDESVLEYSFDIEPSPRNVRLAAPDFMALIEREPRVSAAIWTSKERHDHFIGVVENVLRPLVASQVLSAGGLLLHSAGIVIGGRCFLFVGHSGAGKSTLSGLAIERGHKVLSDDLNFLSPRENDWVSSPMPFAGDYQGVADTAEYPVAAVIRIKKGSENQIGPLSPADCFSLLLSSTPSVNIDSYRSKDLEDTIARVVETVPGWTLRFRKDAGLWPIIEAL